MTDPVVAVLHIRPHEASGGIKHVDACRRPERNQGMIDIQHRRVLGVNNAGHDAVRRPAQEVVSSPLGIRDVPVALPVRHNQRTAVELRPGAAVIEVERHPAVARRNRAGRIQRLRPLRQKAYIADGNEVADVHSLVVPFRTVRKTPALKRNIVGISERIAEEVERGVVLHRLGFDRPQPAIRKVMDLVGVRLPRGVDRRARNVIPHMASRTVRIDIAFPVSALHRPVAVKGITCFFGEHDPLDFRILLQKHALRSRPRRAAAVERDGVLDLGINKLPMRVERRIIGKCDDVAGGDLRPARGSCPPAREVVVVTGRLGERRVLRAVVHHDDVVALELAFAGVERDHVLARHRDRGRCGDVSIPLRGDAVIRLKASRCSLGGRRQRPRAASRGRILNRCAAIRRVSGDDGIGVDCVRGAVVHRRHVTAGERGVRREGILVRTVVDEEAKSLGEDSTVGQGEDERRVERAGLGRRAGKEESVRARLKADAGRETGRRRQLH